MSKALLVLSFLGISLVSLGTSLAPQNPVFWLATQSQLYEYVRILLGLILILQVASRPPRYLWFRVSTGAVASLTSLWVVVETLNNQMLTLDTLSLLAASIAILITSLEGRALQPAATPLSLKKTK